MERFLLFDSGCSLCTELAKAIERETDGRLKARSLREPEVKVLLDRAQPNWRWEPTLLEVDGERVRAFTGLAMRTRLLMKLGLKRTWRIAKLAHQAGMPLMEFGIGRREFIKRGVALLAGLFLWQRGQWGPSAPPQQGPQDGTKHPFQRLRVKKSIRLDGAEVLAFRETASKSADVNYIRAHTAFDDNEAVVYRHELVDGNTLWAVAFPVKDKGFVLYHILARPVERLKSQALYYTVKGETASLQVASVNGRGMTVPSLGGATIQSACDGCDGINFTFDCNACVSINWACVAELCGGTCVPVCSGAGPLAWACLVACCGLAVFACCSYWGPTCCSCF